MMAKLYGLPMLVLVAAVIFLTPGTCITQTSTDLTAWKDLFRQKTREFERMDAVVEHDAKVMPRRLAGMHEKISLLEARVDRRLWTYYGSVQNLVNQRDLLRGLDAIRKQLGRVTSPFEERLETLKQDATLVDETRKAIEKQRNVLSETLPEIYFKETMDHVGKLEKLSSRISGVIGLIDLELKHARLFDERLKHRGNALQLKFETRIKDFFLKPWPHYLSTSGWKDTWSAVEKWHETVMEENLSPGRFLNRGLLEAILTFFIATAVAYGLLLLTIGRWIKRRAGGDPAGYKDFFFWSALAVGLAAATQSTEMPTPGFARTLIMLMLAWGMLALAWKLRANSDISLADQKNPLGLLWVLFAVGEILVASPFPVRALIPIWVLLLVWASRKCGSDSCRELPPVEKTIIRAGRYILPVPALMALAGWGPLSLMVTSILFLVALSVQLGYALSSSIMKWGLESRDQGGGVFTQIIVITMEFPMVFLVLLYFCLGMAMASTGGVNLLYHLIDLKIGWDKLTFSLSRLPLIVAGFFVTRAIVALSYEGLSKLPEYKENIDEGEVMTLKTISSYIWWSIFILGSFYALGASLRNLAIIGGGLSVGIGFGMKNIINNFISGLILLFGRSLKPGDLVQIEDVMGRVHKVTIRNTLIRTASGTSIFVPNSQLISKYFINWSHQNPNLRLEIQIGVPYDEDTNLLKDALMEIVDRHPEALKDPPPMVRFEAFGASSMNFILFFWVMDHTKRWVASEVRFEIERVLKEKSIRMLHNRYDVRVLSGSNPIRVVTSSTPEEE